MWVGDLRISPRWQCCWLVPSLPVRPMSYRHPRRHSGPRSSAISSSPRTRRKARAWSSWSARDASLAQALGEDLTFDGWLLELRGIEPTPGGGYFVRFMHPALADHRLARPTYWNGGPGRITSQAAIRPGSALYEVLKVMKPGAKITVAGNFFPNAKGGLVFESAQLNYRENSAALAKFRAPYFAIRVTGIRPP